MKELVVYHEACKLPQEHMQADCLLLETGEVPTLRVYTWPWPSCTWGIFVRPEELLKQDALVEFSVAHAMRPTGGGLLFHGRDIAFSLFLPRDHPLVLLEIINRYQIINEAVIAALSRQVHMDNEPMPGVSCQEFPTHFCQAKATRYDLCMGGRKIGGCAQRQTKRGFLHQASIFVYDPDWDLIGHIVQDLEQVQAMQMATKSLFAGPGEHVFDEALFVSTLGFEIAQRLIPK